MKSFMQIFLGNGNEENSINFRNAFLGPLFFLGLEKWMLDAIAIKNRLPLTIGNVLAFCLNEEIKKDCDPLKIYGAKLAARRFKVSEKDFTETLQAILNFHLQEEISKSFTASLNEARIDKLCEVAKEMGLSLDLPKQIIKEKDLNFL